MFKILLVALFVAMVATMPFMIDNTVAYAEEGGDD